MPLPGSGRIFSGSRIRTPLGKWDSPDFQIRGRGGGGERSQIIFCRPFGPQFGLNIRGAPLLDPPLIGKENGFQEKMTEVWDTGLSWKRSGNAGWGHLPSPPPPASLQTMSYLLCFISSTFGKGKQLLIHPLQRQQKQQILLRFNI